MISLGRLSHPVHAGAKEFVENIVFVRRHHQPVNRQAHHARDVTRADVAEISGRHSKRHLLLVGSCRRQIAAEVVHHLRHHARPVDRVDRANFLLRLEFQIIRRRLDHVLTVVEHAFDRDVINIRVLQAEHLRRLERAHLLVWRQHEYADALLAAHGIFGRAASIARGRAKDVEFCILFGKRILEQVA